MYLMAARSGKSESDFEAVVDEPLECLHCLSLAILLHAEIQLDANCLSGRRVECGCKGAYRKSTDHDYSDTEAVPEAHEADVAVDARHSF